MRVILYFLFLFFPASVVSQDFQDGQWLIGISSLNSDRIDFRDDEISAEQIYAGINLENSSSICTFNGELVLYSSGCSVWNTEPSLIENGGGLNPAAVPLGFCKEDIYDTPLQQSILILKHPRFENTYYLLILDLDWAYQTPFFGVAPLRLYVNTIDMSANNGLGKVIDKNRIALQDTFSRCCITAVKHGNGRDWYLVVPKSHSDCYFILTAGPEGVFPHDTICDGKVWGDIDPIGQTVFSPDGRYFARADGRHGLHLFAFDLCEGSMEYLQELYITPDTVTGSGVSFSPDSRFLYAAKHLELYQFDLKAEDIQVSKTLIGEWTPDLPDHIRNFYQMQLAPDGKIYIGSTGSFGSLHIIHEPNKKGDSCRLEMGGIRLNGSAFFSIPQFPNYRLGPWDESPCDTFGINNEPVAYFHHESDTLDPLKINFRNLAYANPEAFQWDFGDGSFSEEKNPIYVYSTPGTYEVCLHVSNPYGEDTYCKTIELETSSITYSQRANTITLYPNPASDKLFITGLPEDNKPLNIEIEGITGQVIMTAEINQVSSTAELNLPKLPSGVYFYILRNQNTLLDRGLLTIIGG